MLVLTRRKNEWITIGDDIFFKVLDIQSNCVRLGFDAPRHIPIHRINKHTQTRKSPIKFGQIDYISPKERLTLD